MKITKKILALTMSAVMALSLAACGSSDETTGKKSTESSGGTYKIGICQLVQHEALDAATKGFKTALKDKLGDKVSFDEQNAQGDSATCATIINTFVSSKDDLILANATAPLQAAAAGTDTIPILGTSVTDYATALDISDWTGTTGVNISGTTDLAPLKDQAALLNEMFPNAKKIGMVYCSAEPNSQYQIDEMTKYLKTYGYEITNYSFVDSNDIATVVTNASQNCEVIYIPTDNTAAANTEIINNICQPAGIPIVAGEEGICKGCGVATLSINYYDLGYATGEMAYEILVNGKDIKTMEVQSAPKVTKKYNKELCEALNITAPEGAEAIEQ